MVCRLSGRKKCAPVTGIRAALRGLSKLIQKFGRSGLGLESAHQESLHTDQYYYAQTSTTHGLQMLHSSCQGTSEPEKMSEASYLGCREKDLDCCLVVQSQLFR
ncbi:hypothetical protein XENOCAPTIV_024994 [Xenoophorus captivus]|uniref:Uncharacterized protein n=1 Tax=Xenoophorus captivus TaxID=1517983 RepID=A0ABV0RWQ9_9TELE